MERHPGYVSNMYDKYVGPGVVFVGRQERLGDDLLYFLESVSNINKPKKACLEIPKQNVSSTGPALEWDEDLKQELVALEWSAIKRFGYGSEIGKMEK